MTVNKPDPMAEDELDKSIDKMLTWDINGHTEPVIFQPEMKKAIKKLVNAYTTNKIIEARKKTASDIFNLAHEYAQDDPDMKGAENLRNYHYYNAIAKIGEFDGR